jgi:hypothetical protein
MKVGHDCVVATLVIMVATLDHLLTAFETLPPLCGLLKGLFEAKLDLLRQRSTG